jgi:hypothetical protein
MFGAGVDQDRGARGPLASLTNSDRTQNGERTWARWTRLAGVALAGFAALGANTGASNNLFVVTAAGDFGGAS